MQKGASLDVHIDFAAPRVPSDDLPLRAGEAHFWLSALDIPGEALASLESLLSPDERTRADRYRQSRDRDRYIVCRGRLRLLLAAYAQVPPSEVAFAYGAHGKPALLTGNPLSDLQFNIAHSGNLALFGVTRNHRIGVDIERIRADFPWRDIARRFFAPADCAALDALPTHLQQDAFFACWTRKEAFLKATGEGLSRSLKTFEVSALPDETEPVLRENGEILPSQHWHLLNLNIAPEYAAAAVVEKGVGSVVCQGWRWSPLIVP
jgi:4'-phosphopantetheinyl transferase